jgi:two-component system OmpR family sensor kinase
VLDRFYRVAGSEVSGSGLGLAIVKTIADAHQASVTLDASDALGGLRLTVQFPPAV